MDVQKLASYFDHTVLKPEATQSDILKLCNEAAENHFFAVCLNPFWLPLAKQALQGTHVQLCTVVGFPLGASGNSQNLFQAEWCMKQGAREIDSVINVGALKSRDIKTVEQELNDLTKITRGHALLKVIVESGLLDEEELKYAIEAVNKSGAEFIKTSTGFSTVGATPSAIKMMKSLGRPGLKIKASGGIRDLKSALQFIELGADRIGASKSVDMLNEFKRQQT